MHVGRFVLPLFEKEKLLNASKQTIRHQDVKRETAHDVSRQRALTRPSQVKQAA